MPLDCLRLQAMCGECNLRKFKSREGDKEQLLVSDITIFKEIFNVIFGLNQFQL